MEKQEPTKITIKTNKLARDDRSFSTMSVSLDGDRISEKKGEKKPSKISITGNKITQDSDKKSKEEKVGSIIEGKHSINIESTSIYK